MLQNPKLRPDLVLLEGPRDRERLSTRPFMVLKNVLLLCVFLYVKIISLELGSPKLHGKQNITNKIVYNNQFDWCSDYPTKPFLSPLYLLFVSNEGQDTKINTKMTLKNGTQNVL